MNGVTDNQDCGAKSRKSARSPLVTVERILLVAILAMQVTLFLSRGTPRPSLPGADSHQALSSGVADEESAADSPLSEAVAPEVFPLPRERVGNAGGRRDPLGALLERAMADFERMERFINFDEGWTSVRSSPAMDMRDQPDDYAVVFSLPELHESDVTVTLEGRLLTISCGSGRHTGRSAHHETFVRSVWLPGPVGDPDQAYAMMTNGVLKVMVPKGEAMHTALPRLRLF